MSAARPEGEIDLSNPAASGGGEGESLVGRAKAERGAVRRLRRRGVEEAGRITAHADVMDSFNPHATHQHERAQELITALLVDEDDQGGRSDIGGAPAPVADSDADHRPLAKPPVRKLARDLGVDLRSVTPTGPEGTIVRDDVESAAGKPTRSTEGAFGATDSEGVGQGPAPDQGQAGRGARERREPVKGVRKMMAQAMVDSAFTAPHVTEWITVDVSETIAFVERLKQRREFADVKVSPLLVLARAVILAMRRTPEINSFFDANAGEVVYKSFVNLGIAAATPRGLVVPNIKDAQTLDLHGLAVALGSLVDTARAGRTQPAEMSDGTVTITNVGVFGVDAGTPIINPGESAIIAFGAVRKQPWVVTGPNGEDELAIRHITTLALSFDHRHVDGELGSRFLADVAELLRDPAAALLY